jgi:hypothetical protein
MMVVEAVMAVVVRGRERYMRQVPHPRLNHWSKKNKEKFNSIKKLKFKKCK